MALSWNEIKKRAIEFSKSWEGVEREKAEAQTFWNEFFEVFGQTRRKVAILEQEVKRLDESKGYIDLFWPKVLLAEAKSKGKDLVKAKEQAISYLHGIEDSELPQYILTSDFDAMSLLDLESGESWQFKVGKLHENIKLFSFIAGYAKTDFKEEDPVNIKAAELMGKLHDSLTEAGYSGHTLEVFLVRVLFCLFADDTGIFEKGTFSQYISSTKVDGTDVGPQLAQLFQLLDTPEEKRFRNLDENLARFPYVNGKLFEEVIPMAGFDSTMRGSLIACSQFDWSRISPAVFGSLFQSVMDQKARRNLGAHYTSESNILKVIRPLFLDELWQEFELVKNNKPKLAQFHDKIAGLKFMDPACGCGNFLVITYRELRLLELEVVKKLAGHQRTFDITSLVKLNVDSFYGIEIEEFPARIAEVAMWLVDHQMNVRFSEELGQYFVRLPLKKSANIIHGNALQIDWQSIVKPSELSYILGNPPFVGKQMRSREQTEDQLKVMAGIKGAGVLDFVACWYIKAAQYIQNTAIKVALVSTNSITQGEQVGILWSELFAKYGIKIHFAHRTFQWNSEARGKAAVHVVIIGFANFDDTTKYIFEYDHIQSEPHKIKVKNINPYLVEGKELTVPLRRNPICDVPRMDYGSTPRDFNHLVLSSDEKEALISAEPLAKRFIRPFIGSFEFINNVKRYCLWLENVTPSELNQLPLVKARVELVRKDRNLSERAGTKKMAEYPTLFAENRQPDTDYLVVPLVSSVNRTYVPIGFMDKSTVTNNQVSIVPEAGLFHFAVIQSLMHMTWMRYIAGRLKSDYRYSNSLVYNNFPWPASITDDLKSRIEFKAQEVLNIRADFNDSTLGELYNSLTMPAKLLKAHKELDKLVDKAYRKDTFGDDRERIEFLFELYAGLTQAPIQ
ncbi:MAG: N-6 DNA methylase [Candidatus Dojkabacteria bacterium]|nr:MAG: N-6 DNA methylase [Candidatus Dojkabacteria bacterium]